MCFLERSSYFLFALDRLINVPPNDTVPASGEVALAITGLWGGGGGGPAITEGNRLEDALLVLGVDGACHV